MEGEQNNKIKVGVFEDFTPTIQFPLDKKGTTLTFVNEAGIDLSSPYEILYMNDADLTIRGLKDLHVKINDDIYTIPPKDSDYIPKAGWQSIFKIIEKFIPDNLKESFSSFVNKNWDNVYHKLPFVKTDYTIPKLAMYESGLDLYETTSTDNRYLSSCFIRYIKRYASMIYSKAGKIRGYAVDFCTASGYTLSLNTSKKKKEKVNLEGLTKSQIAAVKALDRLDNPREEKTDVKTVSKEVKFKSVIIYIDSLIEYTNRVIVKEHLPDDKKKDVRFTEEANQALVKIAQLQQLLVDYNKDKNFKGFHFSFPPFFIVDQKSIWNLSTSKDLVLYKEVTLTALKSLRNPMIIRAENDDVYNKLNLKISRSIDTIAEYNPILVRKTFKEVTKKIVDAIKSNVIHYEEKREGLKVAEDQKLFGGPAGPEPKPALPPAEDKEGAEANAQQQEGMEED